MFDFFIKKFIKINKKTDFLIKGFDKENFFKVNPDLKEIKNINLKEIREGKRKFHKDFEVFNEEIYLNKFPDVKESIEKGLFKDGFEHFCLFGYKEIIEGKRNWQGNKIKKIDSLKEEELIKGFDKENFFKANPDLKEIKNINLEEIREGKRKFHKDFEVFNEKIYLNKFPDIKDAVEKGLFKDGFEHFCLFGYKEIIEGKRDWHLEYSSKEEPISLKFPIYKDAIFSPITHRPLISILIVNYNGSRNFKDFFESLKKQTYKNFEVIFVDNASKDDSLTKIENIKKDFSQPFKIIKNKDNEGFAKANNLALHYAEGELISLVNLDTKLDERWLEELFNAMKIDATVSAVSSKTLFFKKFNDIKLYSKSDFSIDFVKLIDSLKYKKFFIRKGNLKENKLSSIAGELIVSLPVEEKISINFIDKKDDVFFENEKIDNIIITNEVNQNSKYIINNVGSALYNDFNAKDRGYGEYDIDQYNAKTYVDLFCGVSVLIRRSAIAKRDLFIPEFFGYYEDSELSIWMRKNKFNILYTPYSVVYHKHSYSFNEFSKDREFLIKRNNKIYLTSINNFENKKLKNLKIFLDNLSLEYKNKLNEKFFNKITELNKEFFIRLQKENSFYPKKLSIGIYNSFWNTKGGGEKHALEIANILQKFGDVYLISEEDFSIKELENYFKLDLKNCKKLIENKINEKFTQNFNIFINSTYNSSLVSLADESYYIVSFPHRNVEDRFIKSYKFLHNSNFTKHWSERWWGKHKCEVLYPLGGFDRINIPSAFKKEKIILSVGRFFVEGHTKNQLETAKIFAKAIKNNVSLKDWKLIFIGGVDLKNHKDKEYLQNIHKVLEGTNYEIITNASFETLENFYKKAYIYIHATGLNKNLEKEPENFEHFGISLVEAIIYGCYPIVFKGGGLKEVLKIFGVGDMFINEEEFYRKVLYNMRQYPKQRFNQTEIRNIIEKNAFENKVANIFLRR